MRGHGSAANPPGGPLPWLASLRKCLAGVPRYLGATECAIQLKELPTYVAAGAVGEWLKACSTTTLSFRQRLRHFLRSATFQLGQLPPRVGRPKAHRGKTHCIRGVPSSFRVKLGSDGLTASAAIRTDRLTSGLSTHEASAAQVRKTTTNDQNPNPSIPLKHYLSFSSIETVFERLFEHLCPYQTPTPH